jgi:hypothetical protein
MKARTMSDGLAFESCVRPLGRPRRAEEAGGAGRPILTYSYRLARVKVLGQADSEKAVPPSRLECCRRSVIRRRRFDGYPAI